MSVMSEIDASAQEVDRILDAIIRHGARVEHHKQEMQRLRDDLRSLMIRNYRSEQCARIGTGSTR